MLPPWTRVAVPHEDILRGELDLSTYAADLGAVARKDPKCPRIYREPVPFFRATHLTTGLQRLLGDVMKALAGGAGDRVLQLRTPFGGGKTHTLVALYHLANAGEDEWHDLMEDRDASPLPEITRKSGWPVESRPKGLRCAVLSGIDLDASTGRKEKDGPHLRTLWGELAWQLGRGEAYALVEKQDQERAAPGADVLRRIIGEKPTLILLDEVLVYVESAKAIPYADTTLGRQVMVFLQRLTEVVRGLSKAALVYSLQKSADEAAGDEALLEDLDKLVTRIDAKREPVTGDEVLRVVQKRLFSKLGDPNLHAAVADEYARLYRKFREASDDTDLGRRAAEEDAAKLAERIRMSYPFHPDLLDLMYHRWGSLPSYQRTRGALRFLACVIRALWERNHDQLLVGPGDVPLDDEQVRGAFFEQVGRREDYHAALSADLVGAKAKVRDLDRRLGKDSPALGPLRVATRLASAAMLYSFGARSGEERGVLESDLVASCLSPDLDRMVLASVVKDLREELLYLHYTGRRYRFETHPNLNKLLHEEARKLSPEEVREELRADLEARLRGARGAVLWPSDASGIPDREPVFQVVYLGLDWAEKAPAELERGLRDLFENAASGKRQYKNALVFAAPGSQAAAAARQAKRQVLAVERLLADRKRQNFGDEEVEELEERRKRARGELEANLRNLYEKLYVPKLLKEGEEAYGFETKDLRTVVGASDPHARTIQAMEHGLSAGLAGHKIASQAGLGTERVGHFLKGPTLVDSFFSYLGFPRLTDLLALQKGVERGVREGRLGYVAGARIGYDGELVVENPRDVRFGPDDGGDPREFDLSEGSFVLSAELAARLKGKSLPEPAPGGTPPSPPRPTPAAAEQGTRTRKPTRYHLVIHADKRRVFKALNALATLSDWSKDMSVEIRITAEAQDSFDPQRIRNGVEEPLDEADIARTSRLE